MALAVKLCIFYQFINKKYSKIKFSLILPQIIDWFLVLGRVIILSVYIHKAALHHFHITETAFSLSLLGKNLN
jgi:hypothetical protein